jgi:protein TonB
MHFSGTTVLKVVDGRIVEEIGLDDGVTISDGQAISGPKKGGLREEAVRVVSLSGKWVPAMEEGRKVRSYKKVPLVFRLEVSKL